MSIEKKLAKRAIEIKCTGAATARLEDLVPLQGGLKKLDPERYRKLKRVLLEHGFSFPFFVWKDAGKLKILDGHQRDRALRRLKAQGYTIPPLPVDFIEALNEAEARKKILLLSSQYGEMTDESLMDYLKESEIDLDDILDTVDLPQVDLEKLSARLEEELAESQPEESSAAGQFLIVITCATEAEQQRLLKRFEKERIECRALIS